MSPLVVCKTTRMSLSVTFAGAVVAAGAVAVAGVGEVAGVVAGAGAEAGVGALDEALAGAGALDCPLALSIKNISAPKALRREEVWVIGIGPKV